MIRVDAGDVLTFNIAGLHFTVLRRSTSARYHQEVEEVS